MLAASAAAVIQVAGAGFASADDYVPIQPALTPPALPADDQVFLNPPRDVVEAKQPGEIIAAREVHPAFQSIIQPDVDAWQLSYRSTNSRDEPIAAVTTVMKPRGSSPSNLLSVQIPEDAVAAHCAPSYTSQLLALPPNYAGTMGPNFMLPMALYAVTKGWAVSIPDHEGLLSAFAAGPLAGRITLDGIRATENFKPMGLPGRDTKVGLWGDSGGSIPTVHAAELRATYAPDVNVVGAVSGSTAADLRDLVDYQNNGPAAGTVFAGIIGLTREYPELQAYIDQHMNPLGQGLRSVHSNVCQGWSVSTFPNLNIKGLFDVPDVTREPLPSKYLDMVKMGNATPDRPMYIFQSMGDWIMPAYATDRLVDTYCQNDGRITYNRITVGEAYSQAFLSVPGTYQWLQERFDGVPVANGCTRQDVAAIAKDDSPEMTEWVSIVGPELTAAAAKP
ncbi:lipase family protein [Nocardia iowensis]|uniref:Lipase family protein n=1 Tax=Nocardia iowensis TaxID=204891 RepID=A0ABX8RZU8_NOCIO|nr:lipase family protein [Nocardia iowensis]